MKHECANIYGSQFLSFQLNEGDIKVVTKAVMGNLINENNKFLQSRSYVFNQNADLSTTLNNKTIDEILIEEFTDIVKVYQ